MILLALSLGCHAPPDPCENGGCEPEVPDEPVELCGPVELVFAGRCLACHTGEDGLDLRDLEGLIEQPAKGAYRPLVAQDGDLQASYLWRKVEGSHGGVGGGGTFMPPGEPLDDDAREAVRAWVAAGGRCEPGELPSRPAPERAVSPVPLRRLNRYELDNSVRDLLGTAIRPSERLPVDDSVDGFDTLGEGLTLSNLHLEQLDLATEELAIDFVERMQPGGPIRVVLDPQQMQATNGGALGDGWRLVRNGRLIDTFEVSLGGDHLVEVRAWGEQVLPDPVQMELLVDGQSVEVFDVPNTSWLSFAHTLHLDPGQHRVAVAFLNDTFTETGDRNLIVESVNVHLVGATDPTYRAYADGLACEPEVEGREACLTELLEQVARRAWRRPLEPDEIERLVTRIAEVDTVYDLPFSELATIGVQAILLSPHFLFRPEMGTTDGRLTDHELATRLATFLWSSLPDEELDALADAGTLHQPEVLEAQVRRMLDDDRSVALVESFGGQWLWLRRIVDGTPDPSLYPEVDDGLREAFAEQAEELVTHALLGDAPVSTLLTASEHWIGPEIASFYGFPGNLQSWQTVDLGPEGRIGLLSNAGLLATFSNPSTTNPVRRGAWVMSQLLCDIPGEPPANAATSFEVEAGEGSLRERFALHRADPTCAACHDLMDPLGFSLEGFGPAGEARETDDLGYPADTSGVLPDGRSFDGPGGLGGLLADDPQFTLCVARQTATYALGTRVTATNWPYILDAHERFVDGGGRFEELVVGLVLSDAFTRRMN